MVSDLLAAERSSHKVDYKGNAFPSVELHLHNSSAHQRGSGLGRTLETHWASVGFMGLLGKACVGNCRCLRASSVEKQLKVHIYVWEYVYAGSCLGLGWDLNDWLGFYLILLLMEAASYHIFKV